MKVIGILASILLVTCADASIAVKSTEDKACSQKCKKPYGLGNKYQQVQKQNRCQMRCKKQKIINVTK